MLFKRAGGIDAKTVVVLGAGATRGSQRVEDRLNTGKPLPPLDADFFTQAQRLQKGREQVDQLIGDAVGMFGNNFALTMELFLTQVEHLRLLHRRHGLPGDPTANPYDKVRENFLQVIALLLDETLGHDPDCPFHAHLVRSLGAGDVVMNFNYDCLMDNALRLHGEGKWNATDGYGVTACDDSKLAYWSGEAAAQKASQILHLKMHGSLHWLPPPKEADTPRIELKRRWWRQNGNVHFDLIPPEWNKHIDEGIYQQIWRGARKALRSAEAFVFIGYSMPPSDLPVQALFRIDAKTSAPEAKLVVLVNPDRDARRRIREVLGDRLGSKTRILVLDTFRELHAFLGGQADSSSAETVSAAAATPPKAPKKTTPKSKEAKGKPKAGKADDSLTLGVFENE